MAGACTTQQQRSRKPYVTIAGTEQTNGGVNALVVADMCTCDSHPSDAAHQVHAYHHRAVNTCKDTQDALCTVREGTATVLA
jgi:hypothetical protein